MNWVLIANTGNYPTTNYVELVKIVVCLSVAIFGMIGIIRRTRKKGADI